MMTKINYCLNRSSQILLFLFLGVNDLSSSFLLKKEQDRNISHILTKLNPTSIKF